MKIIHTVVTPLKLAFEIVVYTDCEVIMAILNILAAILAVSLIFESFHCRLKSHFIIWHQNSKQHKNMMLD